MQMRSVFTGELFFLPSQLFSSFLCFSPASLRARPFLSSPLKSPPLPPSLSRSGCLYVSVSVWLCMRVASSALHMHSELCMPLCGSACGCGFVRVFLCPHRPLTVWIVYSSFTSVRVPAGGRRPYLWSAVYIERYGEMDRQTDRQVDGQVDGSACALALGCTGRVVYECCCFVSACVCLRCRTRAVCCACRSTRRLIQATAEARH